jgi:hypothetical protein
VPVSSRTVEGAWEVRIVRKDSLHESWEFRRTPRWLSGFERWCSVLLRSSAACLLKP